MTHSHAFALFLAMTNYRAFDTIALLFMGGMYLYYYRRSDHEERYRMVSIGIAMLLFAVGSLSVLLVGLSWWLLTDACDKLANRIHPLLPGSQISRFQ